MSEEKKRGRPKKFLTPQEIEEREEKSRASKRESARRRREAKKASFQGPNNGDIPDSNNPTLNFFAGMPIDLKSQEISDTVSVKDYLEGPAIKPFDQGLIENMKDKINNLKNFLNPGLTNTHQVEMPKLQSLPSQDSNERQKLMDEYINILESGIDPKTLMINDELKKELATIETMDIHDLRIKLAFARRHLYKGVDHEVSKQVLDVACFMAGKTLNCYDQLKDDVMKDEYLKNLTNTVLTTKLLYLIPDPIKVGGLFGMHIIKARMAKLPIIKEIEEKETKKIEELQINKANISVPMPPPENYPSTSQFSKNIKIPPHLSPLTRTG
jgi:hypothetical protein